MDTLLKKIAKKDKNALYELYMQTKDDVFRFVFLILKNIQDAEDILQDTYIKVYTNAESYRSMGKPLAWILTIARNLCYEKFREQERMRCISEEDWAKYIQTIEDIPSEDKLILEACMESLSEEERQIVALHAVMGLKHVEIAKMLSIPLPTIRSKYNRALKKMRKYIEEGV